MEYAVEEFIVLSPRIPPTASYQDNQQPTKLQQRKHDIYTKHKVIMNWLNNLITERW
jgi:hypothetical protein